MNTTPTSSPAQDGLSTEQIILIISTIGALVISTIDLLVNAYAHSKSKKIKLACSDCCQFNYDSEDIPETTARSSTG